MVNFINLIRQDDISFSDDIGKINPKKDIIITSRTKDNMITLNSFSEIVFKTNKTITFVDYPTGTSGFEYTSKCNISIPKYLNFDFVSPKMIYYYDHIYTKFELEDCEDNFILTNIRNIILINRDIMRHFNKILSIKKDEYILCLNILFNIFSTCTPNNIYYICDDFIHEDFINHFKS